MCVCVCVFNYCYLFLAMQDVNCCKGFSLVVVSGGYSPVVIRGLLIAVGHGL